MRNVILQGFLGEKYGESWSIVAKSYKEVLLCIEANYPGFKQDLVDFAVAGGDISILKGSEFVENIEELIEPFFDNDDIVITPIPQGAKSGGAKLLFAVLLVASFFIPGSTGVLLAGAGAATGGTAAGAIAAGALTTGATLKIAGLLIASLAINLAMTGIQQLLAPDPSVDEADENYLFSGPQQVTSQGGVVPVLCGEMIISGITMSSAIIPGLSGGFGHLGGEWPGRPGVSTLPGGGSGGFGGILGLIFGDQDDVFTGSDITNIPEEMILYSENTITKPWVARENRTGVHFISPVVPHEISSNNYASHRTAISQEKFKEYVDWSNFTDVVVGAQTPTGTLFRSLAGITTNITADFSSDATIASLTTTLASIEAFVEGDASIVGASAFTFDAIGLTTVGSFTGGAEIGGDLAAAFDSIAISSVGLSDFIGQAVFTLDDLTLSASSSNDFIGILESTLDTLTASSSAIYAGIGSFNITLDSIVLSSVGTAPFIGDLSVTLDTITISAEGTAPSGDEAEATALFARMTVEPDTTRKGLINDLILSLKTASVWNKLDTLYVFAAHDSQAGLLNWKSTSFTATLVGPNLPAHNTDIGFSGATGATSTASNLTAGGYNPSAGGLNYTGTSSHFGIFTTKIDSYNNIIQTTPNGFQGGFIRPENRVFGRSGFGSQFDILPGSVAQRGHYMLNRFATLDGSYYNGVVGAATVTADTNIEGPFNMLVAGGLNGHRIAVHHAGASLNSAEAAALYSALNTYLTAIGT